MNIEPKTPTFTILLRSPVALSLVEDDNSDPQPLKLTLLWEKTVRRDEVTFIMPSRRRWALPSCLVRDCTRLTSPLLMAFILYKNRPSIPHLDRKNELRSMPNDPCRHPLLIIKETPALSVFRV